MKFYQKTASELSSLLSKKECSSKEITEDILNHIATTEPQVEAFISLHADTALQQAEHIDKRRISGESMSPLAGIPIGIKDNINVKGQNTTCASQMLANFVAPYDATVIEKIKQNDMILIGKLNMDEFAIGTSGESSFFKASKNPWNINFTPGGSSSGSAAAVAAGEVPFALGTDTGGSIRVPSAFCGVVGFKPTYGAVSRYGAVAAASSFDQIGPIGRTVTDTAMLYDVIAGYDPRDAVMPKYEHLPTKPMHVHSLQGKKIGIPKELFSDSVSGEVTESVQQAIHVFETLGSQIIPVSIPTTQHALSVYYILSSAEISSNLGRYDGVRFGFRADTYSDWNDMFIKTRSQGFGLTTQKRILVGSYVLEKEQYATYYGRAKAWQQQIRLELNETLTQCDVLLTPTTKSTAFPAGKEGLNPVYSYGMDLATSVANISGNPAITLPCGIGENQLPIGVQLIGNMFAEQLLFDIAYQYEQTVGGFATSPILRGEA